jgi:hypothetical protein
MAVSIFPQGEQAVESLVQSVVGVKGPKHYYNRALLWKQEFCKSPTRGGAGYKKTPSQLDGAF